MKEKCNKKGCNKTARTVQDHSGNVFCSIKHGKQFYGAYDADKKFLKKIRNKKHGKA